MVTKYSYVRCMDSYGPLIISIIFLALVIFIIASFWKVFTKAGKPGWASLIPIYNTYVLIKIANRPGWWILLILFIPLVNIIIWLIVSIDIAKAFGKGAAFGILGLFIFSFIGYPILGFGKAQYTGSAKPNPVPSALNPVPTTPPSPPPANNPPQT